MSTEKPKIDKLTPEQEAQIEVYRERFRKIGLSTEPTNRAAAEKAVIDSYHYLKLPTPEIVWAKDPFEGAVMAAQFAKGDMNVTNKEVQEQASKASYGSFEAQWVSFYAYIAEVLDVEKDNLHEIVTRIVQECGVYWTFEDLVVLTEKPVEIHMNSENKLHNPDGLAIKYGSGRGVYAVNGQRKNSLMEVALDSKFAEQQPTAVNES